jgi:hypothetical protein
MLNAFLPAAVNDYTMPVIYSRGPEAGGRERTAQSGATPASAVWPAAQEAIYIPFSIPEAATFTRGYVYNGATAAGNWDIGIYDESGNRLASSGAVAMSGTNAIQVIAFTASVTLQPGRYYMALVNDNATATVFASAANLTYIHSGPYLQTSAGTTLPTTATFATWVSTIHPCFGVSTLGF